jgi:hypothetical protein
MKVSNIVAAAALIIIGTMAQALSLMVKLPDAKTVEVEVSPQTTIREIMNTIEALTGIPKQEQILRFAGKRLQDNETVKDIRGISNSSVLNLTVFTFPVMVQLPSAKHIQVEYSYTTTARDLKNQIEKLTGIPAAKQKLIFSGHVINDDVIVKDIHEIKYATNLTLVVERE